MTNDRATLQPARASRHDYGPYLDRRLRKGNWAPFFLDFLTAFGRDETLLLSVVLNLGRLAGPDGWILCTPDYLRETPLALSGREQAALLGQLQDRGAVEVATHGSPPRRFLRVDVRRIEELIADAGRRGARDGR